ncbi:hypothetical protein Z950_314 [Sulfitobacter mediterraneus KCTC 32188]|nr:hypothetical protein Z950_314 [Sulfitobacter mediterraneus KCTC 32188]
MRQPGKKNMGAHLARCKGYARSWLTPIFNGPMPNGITCP